MEYRFTIQPIGHEDTIFIYDRSKTIRAIGFIIALNKIPVGDCLYAHDQNTKDFVILVSYRSIISNDRSIRVFRNQDVTDRCLSAESLIKERGRDVRMGFLCQQAITFVVHQEDRFGYRNRLS